MLTWYNVISAMFFPTGNFAYLQEFIMINFENICFQTLQWPYSLLFIFMVKLKQFETPLSVKVSSV